MRLVAEGFNILFWLACFVLVTPLIYNLRRDILAFVFVSLTAFLFVIIPLIVIVIEGSNAWYATRSIEHSVPFIMAFLMGYYLLVRKKALLSHQFDQEWLPLCTKYFSLAPWLIVVGLFMKLLGGDLVHSSIIKIPWSFPLIYGVSDRVFYMGVLLSFASIYFVGFSVRDLIILMSVILFGVLSGSRVTVLIPFSFLLFLHISRGNFLVFLKMTMIGFVFLLVVIGFIGLYRIDAIDRVYRVAEVIDLLLFRLSEFYWPTALMERIDGGVVDFAPSWILTGLLGILPAFMSSLVLGYSVFSRDTDAMFSFGLGNVYMSVPMTPIGEGYYWFGAFGVILIGFMYGVGFAFVKKMMNRMGGVLSILVMLQMYRSSFTLPVAAYAEFVSYLTKDLIMAILLAVIIKSIYARRIVRS